MINKLIKYDFKWINKVMYIYFIILFIVSVAVKIVESMEQTFLILIIDKIVSGTFIALVISIVITCVMRIWHRFINNVYKDESYLTHTLPITKNQIFDAKIIASILSLLLSALVIIICIALVYLNKDTIYMIKNMFQSLVDVYNEVFAICFVIGLVLLILLEVIFLMMTGIFGIVIGHCFNNNKIIKSIFIGIGCYGLLSLISFIILVISGEFVSLEKVSNGFPSLHALKTLGLTFIIVYLVYNLVYYFSAKKIFNKGVNIE